jgi:hypothetical protein
MRRVQAVRRIGAPSGAGKSHASGPVASNLPICSTTAAVMEWGSVTVRMLLAVFGGPTDLTAHGTGRLQLEGNFRDQRLGAASATMPVEVVDSPRCGHLEVSRPFIPPTKRGLNTNLVPVGSPPVGETLCYYKAVRQRARGDSNTQPPDP